MRTSLRAAAALLALAVSAGCTAAGSGETPPPTAGAVPSLEVREPVVWLCRGAARDDEEDAAVDDACGGALDAVAVTAEGSAPEPFEPVDDPAIDCFYVYPTVSQAPGANAPKEPEPSVVATVRAQATLFGEVCRLFVPVYRQVTVAALISGGYFDPVAQQIAYDDVRDAWRSYLNEDNDGRGVVLIGHSQGAMALARLLTDDVVGEPGVGELVVSALLLGGQLTHPESSDVVDRAGGLPACREPGQTACVVGYSAFADVPPADAFFGRTSPGRRVLCTDPTRLSGGDGVLHPFFPTDRLAPDGGLARSLPSPDGAAAFVTYPGAATAECREEDGAGWLQVTPVPGAPLPEADERLGAGWGLHALDVTLALGDLVEVVRRQAEAWPD
jgi:hypothetical protein